MLSAYVSFGSITNNYTKKKLLFYDIWWHNFCIQTENVTKYLLNSLFTYEKINKKDKLVTYCWKQHLIHKLDHKLDNRL